MARDPLTTTRPRSRDPLLRASPFSKPSTKTVEGLRQIASDVGLEKEAQRIDRLTGERPKEIFSGGFISDTFDILNALQYGVTGLIKGKSFMEGVRTRQSFSDKDALGDFGIPGMIAGIAMDIAVDPLTWIAPITLFRKIPGATKVAKASLEAAKKTRAGQFMGSKFIYRFGQDPIYAKMAEKTDTAIAVGQENLLNIVRPLTKLNTRDQQIIAAARKAGKLDKLPRDFLEKVKPAFDELDKLSKEAVDVGLLSKERYAETVGNYLPKLYRVHEVPGGLKDGVAKNLFGYNPKGINQDRWKKLTDIPEDIREAMGEIMEAGYPTAKALMQIKASVEKVKFFNKISRTWATDIAEEGFSKLPDAKRLFTTSQGEIIQKFAKLKNLNQELKPYLRELKLTFKADKEILSTITKVEKALKSTGVLQRKEFFEFFNPGTVTKTMVAASRRLGTLPDRLQKIGEQVKKFKKFEDLDKSKIGLELENLEISGLLERAGFKNRESFFKLIKEPFKKIPLKEVKRVATGKNIQKIIKLQRMMENLSDSLTKFKNIDKKSIDDSFKFLEKTINDIRFRKEEIFGDISALKLGKLAGKYVPEWMHADLTDMITPRKIGFLQKATALFKFNKVILNPSTHARNVFSNFILNDFEGLSPHRLDVYAKAARELATQGSLYKEAKAAGLGMNTFASQELKMFLLGPEGKGLVPTLKRAMSKIANLYQKEEEFAKMAQYIYQKSLGKSADEAFEIAERATFNYAQVTPFIRRLRESAFGLPFITFTVKATPQVVRTLVTKPGKISKIGKIKQAIESQSDLKELEAERAVEPDWIRDGFYIKLPMKDKHGRSAYLDLTYILPFGDLMSGQFIERGIKRETGLPEGLPEALLSKSPFINLVKELGRNEDFFGNKIWLDSDSQGRQLGDVMRHITKLFAPPLIADQIPGGYRKTGERRPGTVQRLIDIETGGIEAGGKQTRTLSQEMLRQIGLKVLPIDLELQEKFAEQQKKNAFVTLLKERGEISEFTIPFVPKDKGKKGTSRDPLLR